MPKITNHKYCGYQVIVSYHLKTSNFSITLPPEMGSYTTSHLGNIISDTQAKVERDFNNIVDKYIKEGAERVKFIAVSVENDARCEDEFVRANGSEAYLKMQYAIITRVKINDEYEYKYKRNHHHSQRFSEATFYTFSEDVVFMKWTEKRERFLEGAIQSIQELSSNIKNFIESDDAKAMIDSNKRIMKIEDNFERGTPGKER